jgi:hypothetical protein
MENPEKQRLRLNFLDIFPLNPGGDFFVLWSMNFVWEGTSEEGIFSHPTRIW